MPPFSSTLTVIGHRGAGAANPEIRENSMESFLMAQSLGARWVELDVRKAADEQIVVWHDEVIGGHPIASLTSHRLAREGIRRLEDILQLLPKGLGIDLDIKNNIHDAVCPILETTAAKVARVARQASHDRPVLLTSFDPALRGPRTATFPHSTNPRRSVTFASARLSSRDPQRGV
jgi:glycerophosphoryl diester phosphodiesterase